MAAELIAREEDGEEVFDFGFDFTTEGDVDFGIDCSKYSNPRTLRTAGCVHLSIARRRLARIHIHIGIP